MSAPSGVQGSSTALTEPERLKLGDLELIIERGLQTFVEVGVALAQIRDQRLYRAEFGTFEEYCATKWGWTDRRARQLMTASEVVVGMEETGTTVPVANEAQARELARVPEEKRAEVWERAVDKSDGKPTAKVVREVAEPVRQMPKEPEIGTSAAKGSRRTKEQIELDNFDHTMVTIEAWLWTIEGVTVPVSVSEIQRMDYATRLTKARASLDRLMRQLDMEAAS